MITTRRYLLDPIKRLLLGAGLWPLVQKCRRWAAGSNPDPALGANRYLMAPPSLQGCLDLFRGEWWSRLPQPWADLRAGQIELFADPRVAWAIAELGGVQGQRVLELGPLEAGHTYMLEQAGAASILAVEANVRAFLKCLVIKEMLGLSRARFLCGDFVGYLRNCTEKFDLCLACGVLYHMRQPAELLSLAGRAADRLILWTHYYDPEIIPHDPRLAPTFAAGQRAKYDGFVHTLYRWTYGAARQSQGFCGGGEAYSHWMTKGDILAFLQRLGFRDIRLGFEDVNNPSGPWLALVARRR